ncbi:hypothetical protein ACU8DI_06390 [Psychroserpens sp. BH13MA-6]
MKKTSLVLIVALWLVACSSEDATNEPSSDNFYALTVGNTWDYRYYLRDMDTDNFLPTDITESVAITETVQIDNETYYNFKHEVTGNDGTYPYFPDNGERNYTLRDSLGFLIDEMGLIKYNNSDTNEHYMFNLDFEYSYYLALANGMDNISTNAGSFTCYDNHYYFKDLDGNIANSLDHGYREDGIGEVLTTMSFVTETEHFIEKRLESYDLQ